MADIIDVEILPDGTMKVSTDKISNANHGGAESLIRAMSSAMGGEASRTAKTGHAHVHAHEDGTVHEH